MPEGIAETIARRVQEFTLEMQPRTAAGSALIDQMATESVRMDLAARHETAATAYRVRHAFDTFDEEQIDTAKALFEQLADDPRPTLRKLRKSPEGVERLIDAWTDLRADLTVGTWDDEQLEQAVNLGGLKARHAKATLLGALTQAIKGDFSALDASEGEGLDTEARQTWAKARIFETIDAEIAGLEAHYETLDFETMDLDRAEAPGRALFDASKPACLARRYEADASRGFFRALREFRKVEAEFAASAQSTQPAPSRPAPAPASRPEPSPAPAQMGSFRETPPSADRGPSRPLPVAPKNEIPVVRDASGKPLSIGRPLQTAG